MSNVQQSGNNNQGSQSTQSKDSTGHISPSQQAGGSEPVSNGAPNGSAPAGQHASLDELERGIKETTDAAVAEGEQSVEEVKAVGVEYLKTLGSALSSAQATVQPHVENAQATIQPHIDRVKKVAQEYLGTANETSSETTEA